MFQIFREEFSECKIMYSSFIVTSKGKSLICLREWLKFWFSLLWTGGVFVIRSGLDVRGTVVRFAEEASDFPLVQIVIPALDPARPPIQSISGGGGGKFLEHEVDQTPQIKCRSEWSCTSIFPLYLNSVYRDSFWLLGNQQVNWSFCLVLVRCPVRT
jgi:hypothetical protein